MHTGLNGGSDNALRDALTGMQAGLQQQLQQGRFGHDLNDGGAGNMMSPPYKDSKYGIRGNDGSGSGRQKRTRKDDSRLRGEDAPQSPSQAIAAAKQALASGAQTLADYGLDPDAIDQVRRSHFKLENFEPGFMEI